jgi:shikimate kinase
LAVERVVLIGFMASGKTEVGRNLARRLNWRHVDLDHTIEERTGRSVAALFESAGEAGFRELEVALTPELMRLEKAVISTGGGWVTNPGIMSGLPAGTLCIFLKVTAAEVMRRLARTGGRPVRPLLRTEDPGARIIELLDARTPLYQQSDLVVDTDGRTPHEIAEYLSRVVLEWPAEHAIPRQTEHPVGETRGPQPPDA